MAMEGYRGFLGLLVSALLVGFLSVIFVLIWVLHFREGLGWDGGALEFNWHPVLAVTGFVFIQGIAIIVYRLPWTWKCSKLLMKSIHAGLNAVAAILAIISVVAVFEYHNVRKIPHMYSLHSWVGLTALILYIQQLVVGFFVFLLPWAPLSLRAIIMPIHVYSGLLLFGTVIATVLMGVTEKLFFVLLSAYPMHAVLLEDRRGRKTHHSFPPEGVFTNTLGLLILVFGALIFWIVTRPQWKRPREPGSIPLQLNGGGNADGMEGAVAISSAHSMDPADAELSSEGAARKRTLGLADNGQRSTM
ncbi:plasma membrane ascorbate-dependent reductase CYBRD1 [Apodemus sylvaticus]|uniref:plasma membrane ascorbate-dependent reductase CYBRD1 n=1 Tax=Apodemus sylvaticus TaxID=10129 RepID=UPI00224304B4|nr:plasma membrane ascorbate-dependent reductase CYBRD1 [Apodemus sylvaticus]